MGSRVRRLRIAPTSFGAAAVAVAVVMAGCSGSDSQSTAGGPGIGSPHHFGDYGTEHENTGSGVMVKPTMPVTPSADTYFGTLTCTGGRSPNPRSAAPRGCTRVFHLTAEQLSQHIANFPLRNAMVWGYQAPGVRASTPGPTLISYQGEPVQIVETNKLPEPTTIHPHGLHQPNSADDVPVISQPQPIQSGKTYSYPVFTPGHVGTFAYHSHFDSAVQEQRGLDGMWDVLPRREHISVRANVDVNMTLQIWDWTHQDQLVKPFGEKVGGQFPFDTINGKTGDASGGPITIHGGDLVRIRVYNASQQTHAMHLHGHDEILVSKNGHAVPPTRETTQIVAPGDFVETEFRADNPGNWIFHCHFPHHTSNRMTTGYNGAPVGMTRIFHYAGSQPINPKYFSSAHYKSATATK